MPTEISTIDKSIGWTTNLLSHF